MGAAVIAVVAFAPAPVLAQQGQGQKIIVSGASGQLGGLVVEFLLERGVTPGDLILVSRTPDELGRYERMGASTRYGDFTQPESLAAAYAGGTRMLLISVGGGGGRRPELHKNAIDAAVVAGVQHIAYTSYVNADRNTLSALARDHRRTEEFLEQSGVAWTLLRNQIYANGLVEQAAEMVASGELVTHRPDSRVAYVTREDCAAAAAAVLATGGHENKAYNITGPEGVGPRELAALASEVSGRPVVLIALEEPAYVRHLQAAGMSAAAIEATLSFAAELDSPYFREPSTAVEALTGHPATSVRELLEANRERLLQAGQ
jgi:NAD(P)H dehydrogenase (quinone)